MIAIKDLMIGNWVIFNNEIRQVRIIRSVLPIQYNPIPVTPELLERIGFEKGYDKICKWDEWAYRTENYHLAVKNISNSLNKDWYVHIDGRDFNPIGAGDFQHLHELQNLVRVITGHDLPITKEMLM